MGISLLLRFWYIPVILVLIGLVAYFRLDAENAGLKSEQVERELAKVVQVNKHNAKELEKLQEDLRKTRETTEKEIAQTRERAQAIDEIKKDMDNVEGANDPAGPFWDAFSKRLSDTKRNH